MTPLEVNKFYQGDALEVLRSFPDNTFHCCVTSPPYYGLRSYLPNDHPMKQLELGNESTPEAYVSRLVDIFREVRRVLRPEGLLFLNIGDSYAGSWGNSGRRPELDGTPSHQREKNTEYFYRGGWDDRRERPPTSYKLPGLKPKDLIGIPWMVAFALRNDGWWLRGDIIWAKKNPLPESVRDRPTRSHEFIFLLSKSARYYYDAEAVKEPVANPGRSSGNKTRKVASEGERSRTNTHLGSSIPYRDTTGMRNRRDVWSISVKPFKGAHFAVFPEDLIEPCILAGTSEHGVCPACGKPWERELVKAREEHGLADTSFPKTKDLDDQHGHKRLSRRIIAARKAGEDHDNPLGGYKTTGWRPTCQCNITEAIPALVLDPFSGAGTTALVANRLGRNFVGIDLSESYCQMAGERISKAEGASP